jgi:hypothetical protein
MYSGGRQSFFAQRPRLTGAVIVAMAGGLAVKIVQEEVRVPPHGPAQVALVAAGVLSPAGIVVLDRHPIGSLRHLLAEMATGLGLLLFGLYFGFGGSRLGHSPDAPTWVPRSAQTFGAGIVIGFALLLLALGCRVFGSEPAAPIPSPPLAGTGEHLVHIYDVRPDPNYPDHQFEPYFMAGCDCGWVGEVRSSSDEATLDGYAHDPSVAPGLERPVG